MGSLRNRDCGQKAPRTLSVVPLFGGRRPKFFSHWSSACQTRNCGFLLSLFFSVLKDSVLLVSHWGEMPRVGGGRGRSLIPQSLRQRDLPSDLGGFPRGLRMKSRMLRGICNTVLLENKQ